MDLLRILSATFSRYDGADTKAAICADDWSIEWSSLACHQLGYPRPMSDGVASSAATQLPIVRLNTSSVSNSLQAAVYPAGEADVCSKGAVAIGCHPAGKNNAKDNLLKFPSLTYLKRTPLLNVNCWLSHSTGLG